MVVCSVCSKDLIRTLRNSVLSTHLSGTAKPLCCMQAVQTSGQDIKQPMANSRCEILPADTSLNLNPQAYTVYTLNRNLNSCLRSRNTPCPHLEGWVFAEEALLCRSAWLTLGI